MAASYFFYADGTKVRALRRERIGKVVYITTFAGSMNEPVPELVRKYGAGETARLVFAMGRGTAKLHECHTTDALWQFMAIWKAKHSKMPFFGTTHPDLQPITSFGGSR